MRRARRLLRRWPCGLLTIASVQFFAAALPVAQRTSQSSTSSTCLLEPGPRHSVVGVENSETLRLADGRRVRLLGTLGPRAPLSSATNTTQPATWQPEQNAKAALETLVEGRDVTLAFDQRRRDRYGRWLAHVFVWHNGQRFWVQGELLSHGHARAFVLPGTTACAKELVTHENLARVSARGLWRHRYYRILKPEPADWLLRKRRHRFEIVSGKVADVAVVKSRIYLNFGRNWRNDFTATLPKRALVGTRHTLADITALKGRQIQVRGWIERNNGPFMKLAHPDLIEVLGPSAPSPLDPYREPPALAGATPDLQLHEQLKRQLTQPRIKQRTKKRPKPEVSKPEASDALKL